MKILACDKTGFFEMYKQGQMGTLVSKICIGNTCIKDNGYAKSSSYPICLNVTVTNITNATNTTTNNSGNGTENATNSTLTNISFSSTNPVGTILAVNASDNQTFSFTLSNPSNLSTAASWFVNGSNQTGAFNQSSFSMTNVPAGSYGIMLIISSSQNTIMKNWTLAAIIAPNATNVTNATNSTNATNATQSINVSIGIAPWFPQGRSYVFKCNATGFTPTQYDFNFGNGHSNNGRTTNDVYYTYPVVGSYTVSCTAKNATFSQSSSFIVTVA
jgi:hypothetical protein